MNKLKPELSVVEIGKWRFALGIVFGIFYGTLSLLWFLLLDKAYLILFHPINKYEILKTDLEFSLFDGFLLSTICAALGFCFTMFFWTSKPLQTRRKRNLKLRVAHTNALFLFMLIQFVFTKFWTFGSSFRYDGFELDLKEGYGYLSFSLPIFIFLFNWLMIGRAFKSGKWMIISAISVLIFGGIMGLLIT